MGLDLVELIMDVEDEFSIAVDDHDASRLETVGQLFDYVVEALRRKAPWAGVPCHSARCFYEVRRRLLDDRAVRQMRVRPDTPIYEVAREGEARAVLKRLTRRLNLPMPPARFAARTGLRDVWPDLRVKDLVLAYAAQAPNRFFDGTRVDEPRVWDAVRKIVLKYAPGDPARITRQSRFIKDLRLC